MTSPWNWFACKPTNLLSQMQEGPSKGKKNYAVVLGSPATTRNLSYSSASCPHQPFTTSVASIVASSGRFRRDQSGLITSLGDGALRQYPHRTSLEQTVSGANPVLPPTHRTSTAGQPYPYRAAKRPPAMYGARDTLATAALCPTCCSVVVSYRRCFDNDWMFRQRLPTIFGQVWRKYGTAIGPVSLLPYSSCAAKTPYHPLKVLHPSNVVRTCIVTLSSENVPVDTNACLAASFPP